MAKSNRETHQDLDQIVFALDKRSFAAFVEFLDSAPKQPAELEKLLSTQAPWE